MGCFFVLLRIRSCLPSCKMSCLLNNFNLFFPQVLPSCREQSKIATCKSLPPKRFSLPHIESFVIWCLPSTFPVNHKGGNPPLPPVSLFILSLLSAQHDFFAQSSVVWWIAECRGAYFLVNKHKTGSRTLRCSSHSNMPGQLLQTEHVCTLPWKPRRGTPELLLLTQNAA